MLISQLTKLLFLVVILKTEGIDAVFNVFLDDSEAYKLTGIQHAQLFFVRKGIVNQNAVDFVGKVKPNHNVLSYNLTNLSDERIVYDASVTLVQDTSSDQEGIASMDQMVFPLKDYGGSLEPHGVGSLNVDLNCTGDVTGNLSYNIEISFKNHHQGPLFVVMKRRKYCVKSKKQVPAQPEKPSALPSPTPRNDEADLNKDFKGGGTQQSTRAFYIAVGTFAGVIFIIVFVVICVNRKTGSSGGSYHQGRIDNQPHTNQFLRPDLPNNATKKPSHSSLVQYASHMNDLGTDINEIRNKLTSIAIPRSQVVLCDLIMKGTFARICKGTMNSATNNVYIKTVSDAATDEQKRLLLFESSLLRGMHHRNILSVKSVVLDDVPMVIYPFLEGGNLKHFLHSIKLTQTPGLVGAEIYTRSNYDEQVTNQDLVEMAIQIACGMTYLSKKNLVHKDLATRNCVVDAGLKVKIADNALSRDVFPSDYCCLGDNENRPVRWLALESLVHKVYSTASDVIQHNGRVLALFTGSQTFLHSLATNAHRVYDRTERIYMRSVCQSLRMKRLHFLLIHSCV